MESMISIIMGVYNEKEQWIKESIYSILNQSYKDIEFIIILDNPNNIRIKEYIEKISNEDSRVKFYVNEKNLGLVKTLNKAIELSSGKYIARMDADDISLPNRLEKQISILIKENIDIVGSRIELIDEEGNYIGKDKYRPIKYNEIKKHLMYGNAFAHPTLIFRKDLIQELEGYREVEYAEDYDLVMRALKKKKKLLNINEVLLKYRIRKNGISVSNRVKQTMAAEYIRAKYKNYEFSINDYKCHINDDEVISLFDKYYFLLDEFNQQHNIKNLYNLIKLVLGEKVIFKVVYDKNLYRIKRSLKIKGKF